MSKTKTLASLLIVAACATAGYLITRDTADPAPAIANAAADAPETATPVADPEPSPSAAPAAETAALAAASALASGKSTEAESAGSVAQASADGASSAPAGPAPGYTVLHRFTGPDGWQPFSGLKFHEGFLYGSTHAGGAHDAGVIFRLRPDGSDFSVIHEFNETDGREPFEGLTIRDGYIYGAAKFGGETNHGVLFRITIASGSIEILHHFTNHTNNGFYPHAGPVMIGETLYGTVYHGGRTTFGGILYAFDLPTRTFRILADLDSATGRHPTAQPLQIGDWLYGTASDFGRSKEGFFGSLYRINFQTGAFEVIHRFEGGEFGGHPYGTLVSDGLWLYGNTFGDFGDFADSGVIFRHNLETNAFEILYAFAKHPGSGAKPNGSMILAEHGAALYGSTHGDEDFSGTEAGTLFRITTDGENYEVLHRFDVPTGGMIPMREPIMVEGALYGVTAHGGFYREGVANDPGGGVIYRFVP